MTRNLDIYEKEVDLHSLGRKKRLMQNTTGIFEFVNDFFFLRDSSLFSVTLLHRTRKKWFIIQKDWFWLGKNFQHDRELIKQTPLGCCGGDITERRYMYNLMLSCSGEWPR